MANDRFAKLMPNNLTDSQPEDPYNIRVHLFDIKKEHKDWVASKEIQACNNHYDHISVSVDKNGDIVYLFEQMDDYHNCKYSLYTLTIELPQRIRNALQSIAAHAQIQLKQEFRKLLGL